MKNKLYKHKIIRVGSAYDGGYFVCPNSILKANNLISLGIETNWEFEKDFLKKNPKTIITCYDGQTNYKLVLRFFFIQIIKTLLLEFNFSLLKRSFDNLFEFSTLLEKKLNFSRKNIGLKNGLTFGEVISNKENVFLKIDIEGSEYRILKDILKFKNKLIGLVIEFHDYDLNKTIIKDFVDNVGLEIIHVNINEMGGISLDNYPLVVELTFSKEPIKENIDKEILKKPNFKNLNFIPVESVKL
tara:strand:- start:174 stop:902 length:729 start_codon:yes stop_codon:yes gene_type:complete